MDKSEVGSLTNSDIVSRVLRLLDLSIDIETNKIDTEFVEDGGSYIYVFDENIFEFFISPEQGINSSSSFYDKHWLFNQFLSGNRIEHLERLFPIQTAIICAEYLLNEDLPSASNNDLRDNRIFMTKWHQEELIKRVKEIAEDQRENISSKAIHLSREMKCKRELAKLIDEDFSEVVGFLDELTKSDVDKIRDRSKGVNLINRYAKTRLFAKEVSQLKNSEQIDQLRRIVLGDVSKRISSIHTEFKLDADKIDIVKLNAKEWEKRLSKEVNNQAQANIRTRGKRSIRNDAMTVSLIQYLAENETSEQKRILFITGDNALYNCYRRWYVKKTAAYNSSSEPFIMRRISQYIPLLNISSSNNDVKGLLGGEEPRKLFNFISRAIEIALLPFNMSITKVSADALRHPSKKNWTSTNWKTRHHVALKKYDNLDYMEDPVFSFFLRKVSKDWYADSLTQIIEISDLWKNLERDLIGTYFESFRLRLTDSGVKNNANSPSTFANFDCRQMEAVLLDELSKIVKGSEDLWLPAAMDIIRGIRFNDVVGDRRSPTVLWFNLDEKHDVNSVLAQIREGNHSELKTLEISDAIAGFSLAASLSIYKQDWENADHFINLARNAISNSDDNLDKYYELEFMKALNTRFKIGRYKKHLIGDDESSAKKEFSKVKVGYAKAKSILMEIIEYYKGLLSKGTLDKKKTGEYHLLLARPYSEMASLEVFMALSEYYFCSNFNKFANSDSYMGHIYSSKDHTVLALEGVKMCVPNNTERVQGILMQCYGNIASSEVLRRIFTPIGTFRFDEQFSEHSKKIDKIINKNGGGPFPMYRAFLHYYVGLRDDKFDAEVKQNVEQNIVQIDENAFSINFDIFSARLIKESIDRREIFK